MKYAMICLMLSLIVGCGGTPTQTSSLYAGARNYNVNTAALDKEMKEIRKKRIEEKGKATVHTPQGIYTIYY